MYVHAGREGDFVLHYLTGKLILSYFFVAASHWSYARDETDNLRCLKKFTNTLINSFLDRKHVFHLANGFWNEIWSKMNVESTYMKIGKGPKGLICKTTREMEVKIWALNQHLCGELMAELEGLRESKMDWTKHEEGYKERMKTDAAVWSQIPDAHSSIEAWNACKKNSSKYIQWKAGKIRCKRYQLTRNWGEWDDQILGDFTRWIQANIQIPNCDSVHNQKKKK